MSVSVPRLSPVATVRGWLQDHGIRQLTRNVGYLLGGNAAAYPIELIALALTARALGPEAFGVLVLIQTYVRTLHRLFTFQSWQALIRYGADALEQGRTDDFRSLIKFGLLLDIATALAACGIGVALVPLAGYWLDWSHETTVMASVFCLALAFNVSGTPIAVLRLFDRFKVFAYWQVASAGVRLALVSVGFVLGAGLWAFIVIGIVVQILRPLFGLVVAALELRHQGISGLAKAPLRGLRQRFPGIWGFAWSTNIASTVRMSTMEFDTLVVGGLVDPAAVGLYHLAKRMVRAGLQLGLNVQQAVYPQIARLWSQGEHRQFRKMVLTTNFAIGAIAVVGLLVVTLGADQIILWTVGDAYLGAAPLLILQTLAGTVYLAGIALQPALLSMGLHRRVLQITFATTAAFHVCLLATVPIIGVTGASLAQILFSATGLAGMLVAFLVALRHAEAATKAT